MVKQIMSDFAAVADFVVVYVAEAHPTDGWAISGHLSMDIKQHRSLEERLAAAEMLALHDIPCPILVDTMDNAAARAYAAIPDRLYIVLDGVCVYKGEQGPNGYHPEEVRDWLQKFSG
ncbi:type I iodothyronine deiodinase-like [Branchiostoma floridae]|uniref:Iodothyronine deiodinase n=1 Tax=Branchiostoma floridae TaxID=7739 RepID=A0A9J7N7T3_BRAFL|nr:type I iodothyronine deiodinase-like [Branchiostoma floridae]